LRIVICWIGVSGYLAAGWRALAARKGVDLRLVLFPTIGSGSAPFRPDLTAGLPVDSLDEGHVEEVDRVAALVAAHRPDVVVIPGWATPAFRGLPFRKELEGAKFVLAMDTPRRDDWRQKLGRFGLRNLLSRVDRLLVPGERAWQYARQLGFSDARIRRGMYCVDYARFQSLWERRMAQPDGWPRRFLFTGRYEETKGVDVLLEAYGQYRQKNRGEAWSLACCGKGPMAAGMKDAKGVEDLGFVQPADQPDVWARCGAFVLASRYDPWPLVIVESCAAGFPILCTEACGSSVELVRSHYNGLTVGSGDVAEIVRGMCWLHERCDQLPEMGRRSQQLAAAYSAEVWAERWVAMCGELIQR
jgi:glycosyltransferase involved in cell wall biosynthesis